MTDPVNPPADPAGPKEPVRLPDDHPLVTAFGAQKTRNTELQTRIDSLTAELANTKDKSKQDDPEWKQKFDELQAELTTEREARTTAETAAANANRIQYGLDKGLPKAMAELLVGLPDDQVDNKIAELAPLLGSGPKPNPQQGNPSQGRGGTLSAGRERYAETHK